MNKLSKIALIILVAAFCYMLPTSAVILDKEYLKAKITEDLNLKYKSANPDGEVIVKSLPTVNIDLKGSKLAIDTYCDFSKPGQNKLAKVTFFENGVTLRTIAVPVEIKAYDNVLVATQDIQKGEKLTSSNTKFEKKCVGLNVTNAIAENFDYSNMVALKPIKTGDILDKRYVEKQVTILRSTPVVAIFQSGGISLSIEVTAMENGGLGDYIKVHSSEYKRTYQGKVISPNQVLIQI